MKIHITYISLLLVIAAMAFSLGQNKAGKIENLTAWALINERANGGLILAEAIRREDTEDSLMISEGQVISELAMLGKEEFAYSEMRQDFFNKEIMYRIKDYAEKHPDSHIAQYLNEQAHFNHKANSVK